MMRVLLLYPLFPKSFWSFDKVLELIGRKVSLPPLSLITVAAILPQTWKFRLVNRNIGYEALLNSSMNLGGNWNIPKAEVVE